LALLHYELLEQAQHLLHRERKNPRQASIRRAVSAAYYALFHMLMHEASRLLVPRDPAGLRERARRAVSHADVRSVCRECSTKKDPGILDLTTQPLEQELVDIASAFDRLYEARIKADYDLAAPFDPIDASYRVEDAEKAMEKLRRVKGTPNAKVFLTALFLNKTWNKNP
jgi:uncharacterized protein (UPF0332 family)